MKCTFRIAPVSSSQVNLSRNPVSITNDTITVGSKWRVVIATTTSTLTSWHRLPNSRTSEADNKNLQVSSHWQGRGPASGYG